MKSSSAMTPLLIVLASAPGAQLAAQDLTDLIPNLYGGDGITLGLVPTAPEHVAHFESVGVTQIGQFNNAIASEVRPLPITPSAGGITYEFDPATGNYRETSSTLGPIVAERPQTLGRGKFSLGISASYFEYDEFEGDSLDSLQTTLLHPFDTVPGGDPNVPEGFENDTIRVNFDVDLRFINIALGGTYGVTDNLDVSVLIPFVDVDMDVRANAQLVVADPSLGTPHLFDPATGDSPTDSASGSATGLGDVLLGVKYYWLHAEAFDLAGALRLKLETGDEDDFLGTGSTTVLPFVIGSYKITDAANGHINFGYEVDFDDSDRNVLTYAVGFDVGDQTFTGAVDFLARHELHGDDLGENVLDGSFGLKWKPTKNLIVGANVVVPVNDDGLRSDFISTLALEYRN